MRPAEAERQARAIMGPALVKALRRIMAIDSADLAAYCAEADMLAFEVISQFDAMVAGLQSDEDIA